MTIKELYELLSKYIGTEKENLPVNAVYKYTEDTIDVFDTHLEQASSSSEIDPHILDEGMEGESLALLISYEE